MIFYLTFGQKSPAKNGWIEVYADHYATARLKVIEEYALQWAGLYTDEQFKDNKQYYPDGKIGELVCDTVKNL